MNSNEISRPIELRHQEIGRNEWVNRLWHLWCKTGIVVSLDFVLETSGFYNIYSRDSAETIWIKEELNNKVIWLED